MNEGQENALPPRRVRDWLRRQQWRIIVLVLVACFLSVVFLGYTTTNSFERDFAANLAADAVVAAVAFYLVDVVFGLRERRRQRIEAQRIAYHLLHAEMQGNAELLEEAVGVLRQTGGLYSPWPSSHYWVRLQQSPLIARLPSSLVWAIEQAYSEAERQLSAFESASSPTDKEGYERVCAEFVPKFQDEQDRTRDAIRVLGGAFDAK